MDLFYFDKTLLAYERLCAWDNALSYLEMLYSEMDDQHILYSLIGFSWFYLIEGPVVSKKYSSDQNVMALSIWKKYIDIGVAEMSKDPFFNFIAGYTLSLHGYYINEEYEKKGHEFMVNCVELSRNTLLYELANNFLKNEHSGKYVPVNNGKEICLQLFNGDSLVDNYFNEIYSSK